MMNSYEICELMINIIGFCGVLGILSFVVFYTCTKGPYGSPALVAASEILCISCLIIFISSCTIYAVNNRKCKAAIKDNIEAKYGNYKVVSEYDDGKSTIDGTFEFEADEVIYKAHYSVDQDAIIIEKLNSKGVQKIKNIFGK